MSLGFLVLFCFLASPTRGDGLRVLILFGKLGFFLLFFILEGRGDWDLTLGEGKMNYFPDEVMEHVFDFVTSNLDRNAISLVCKSWYRIERFSRRRVFIGNCYAISPERLIARFPGVKSLTLKGKPHFADFNLVPHDWGGFVYPWIDALARSRVNLEELRLKRMVVTDDGLELISRSFVNFKSLVLVSCDGFTTDGLAAIAANCR